MNLKDRLLKKKRESIWENDLANINLRPQQYEEEPNENDDFLN